jgi:hypothetical protein
VVQVHYDEGIANHIGPEPCADPPHPLGLLRAHGKWPRCHSTASKRDELASSHLDPAENTYRNA